MHLPVTGKLYLHDDVFASDINLLRFVSPAMGQTIEIPIFCVSPKPVHDQANLSYVISAYSCSPPVGLFVCLCVLHFLALK